MSFFQHWFWQRLKVSFSQTIDRLINAIQEIRLSCLDCNSSIFKDSIIAKNLFTLTPFKARCKRTQYCFQQLPTLLDVTCCVRLHTLFHIVGSCCVRLHVAYEYQSRLITATLENVKDFTSTSLLLTFSKNLV